MPTRKRKSKDGARVTRAAKAIRQARSIPETDSQASGQLGTILLVDDSPDDAFLIGRAFRQVGVANPLVVVRDGEQALRYLKGEGPYAARAQFPIPRLILLDLDMPGMTGFRVLTWIRRESNLRHLPVIILTTSTFSPDVKRAYQLGANSFLTKPTDFTDLISVVKEMSDFWLKPGQMPISEPAEDVVSVPSP